jgi:drug/metabolite transporter (DMT)-like permease
MSDRRSGLGIAAIATAWGSIGVIVRQVDLPAVAIVASRCWLGALGLAVWALVDRGRRRERLTPVTSSKWLIGASGVVLAVHWMFLVSAQQRAPIGTVLLLTYLAPVLVTALAPWVLGEHVPKRTYLAVGVAVAGTALLARPHGGDGLGLLFAVFAGITDAGLILVSKKVLPGIGGRRLALWQLTAAGIVMVVPAAAVSWGPPQWSWLWLVALGFVGTALLGAWYLSLLDRLPAATVGVLLYLEPVSAVLMAWVFLGETPTLLVLTGGSLVVVAGMMVLRATGSAPVPVDEGFLASVPR